MSKKIYEDLYNKGTNALKRKNFQEALDYFKKANELEDDDPELFCNMGTVYLDMGDLEKGKSFLLRSLSFDPHNPISLINLAKVVFLEGDYDEAIKILERLLNYNPDFQQAHPILMQIKRQKEFFDLLNVKGKNLPEKAISLFKKFNSIAHQGKLPEALIMIKAIIQEYPQLAEAYLYLGIVEKESGDQQIAFKHFSKALELDPDLFFAWVHKGWGYFSQGLYNEAIKCYDKAIELNPNYSASYNNKGLVLVALKNYEEAMKYYNKSIELNPDFEGAYNNRASCYEKTNQYERAMADYMKILELNPYDDYSIDKIESLIKHIIMSHSSNFRIVSDARDYCLRCGRKNYTNSELCPYCRTPMHRDNVQELLETAIEDEYSGNFENALISLLKINLRDPTSGPAWFCRGKAHCALGEFKNALMCFKKSIELGFNPFMLSSYGWRAQDNISNFKQPDLSVDHLATVEVHIDPLASEDEITWNVSGATLQMLMQYEEAYKCYQNALKMNPDFTAVKKNMERIEKLSKI